MPGSPLQDRVTRAAEDALAEQHFVSAIDVLLRLGWLAPSHVAVWRQGRVDCLERLVPDRGQHFPAGFPSQRNSSY